MYIYTAHAQHSTLTELEPDLERMMTMSRVYIIYSVARLCNPSMMCSTPSDAG